MKKGEITPGIGSIGIIQGKGVVVTAGNNTNVFLRQAFDELRRGLCLVHDLHRCCSTGTVLAQSGLAEKALTVTCPDP